MPAAVKTLATLESVRFTALGAPVAQGSHAAIPGKNDDRPFLKVSNESKLKAWRKTVAQAARVAMGSNPPLDAPCKVSVCFFVERGKTVDRPQPSIAPDLDKYARALGDALTGIVFTDDSRVCEWHARKAYGSPARAEVEVSPL